MAGHDGHTINLGPRDEREARLLMALENARAEVLRLTAERDEARLYAEMRDSGESVEPPPWWEIRQEGA